MKKFLVGLVQRTGGRDTDAGVTQTLSYSELIGTYASGSFSATDSDGVLHVTAGKDNDVIQVTTNHAVISGGKGDDVISASGGDATILYSAGDGSDTIIDLQDSNAVKFGTGLSADNLTVSQSLHDDGLRYLDLDFGNGDIFSIQGGDDCYRFAYQFQAANIEWRIAA